MSSHAPDPRLLLAAPNWFGDTLLATALIRAVKLRQPSSHLAVLAVPRAAEILRGQPHIDEIIVYDERGSDRGWWAKRRIAQRLRAGRFDAALLLRPSLSRAALLWWAGIPRRIGHAHPAKGWLLTDRVAPPAPAEHRADAYLRLLAAVDGPAPGDVATTFVVPDAQRALLRQWLHAQDVMNDQLLIVLHPAANWKHKRWPAERFAELGDRLQAAHGARIVITGAEADRAVAERVRRAMHAEPIVAAGELSVPQLGALLERAELLVVNDSGPLHLAVALKRPFLALFGPTSPAMTGPYHPARGRVLHHPDCCPQIPCYYPDDPPHAGMRSLSVEEVFASAGQLLTASTAALRPAPHG